MEVEVPSEVRRHSSKPQISAAARRCCVPSWASCSMFGSKPLLIAASARKNS